MKKTLKKLVLAKETVRDLGAADLGKAAGGSGNFDCFTYVCATSAGPYLCAHACIEPNNG